jgi:Phosphodiester glycosidase
VLRPASRRASQQGASPRTSPYEPDDTVPLRRDATPYGPGPREYQPGPSPYGPPAPGSYGQDPHGQDPYGQGPYGGDPYTQGPYQPGPYQPGPYQPGQYEPGRYEPTEDLPAGDDTDDAHDADGPGRRRFGRGRRRGATAPKGPKVPKGRFRRLLRRPTVRVILALIVVLCCWLAFSIGQALTAPGGGSLSTKLAEWARDHYLGPVVTFGEWLTYSPPKVGGQPSFSLAVPSSAPTKYRHTKTFQPIIPHRLSSMAGAPLPGEGQWRVLETVKGEPAIFGTFLRPSAVYTSYVAGIVSMDQRLVSFQLRPGSEDPGPGHWHAQSWIPPGTRTGLLATFNGGFKINTSGGGFYLNGHTAGTLTNGAASVVYYRNGTIKIGVWGRDVRMTSDVVGVRQNLRLIVDHGRVPASVNQDVLGSWGATLGGGYYVWRSGLGITRDGRVIFVYGPALNVQELADLLQRAGAVEALQLDINPAWTAYDYYKAQGHPSDPTPVNLLPDQPSTSYRYYSVYSRDFTAVYAR